MARVTVAERGSGVQEFGAVLLGETFREHDAFSRRVDNAAFVPFGGLVFVFVKIGGVARALFAFVMWFLRFVFEKMRAKFFRVEGGLAKIFWGEQVSMQRRC